MTSLARRSCKTGLGGGIGEAVGLGTVGIVGTTVSEASDWASALQRSSRSARNARDGVNNMLQDDEGMSKMM